MVEGGAIRGSLANRNDQWEAQLFAAYRLLTLVEDRLVGVRDTELITEWHQRNAKFHDCLVQNCNNAWLIGFRRQLHDHSIRYHRLALKNNRKHRDVRTEHAAIFNVAIEGDVEACVRLVEDHISATVADVEAYLPKAGEDFAESVLRSA